MKATRNFSWTAFILSASFAACSSSPAPQPSPTSTAVACPAIELAPPQLAYPIPGATKAGPCPMTVSDPSYTFTTE